MAKQPTEFCAGNVTHSDHERLERWRAAGTPRKKQAPAQLCKHGIPVKSAVPCQVCRREAGGQ